MSSTMEWVMMYSGRPSSSRPSKPAEDKISIADQERKQAEDFVNENSNVALEELLEQNKELQKLKAEEHLKLKNRKCPTLEEQERGPDGRIIFSEEYIDFILYRELQPLIDLRVLKHVEQIILDRIAIRDGKRRPSEEGDENKDTKEPSTSTASPSE